MSYTIFIDGRPVTITNDAYWRPAITEFRTPLWRWLRVQLRLAFEDFAAYLAR